jgi:hypothetical protein
VNALVKSPAEATSNAFPAFDMADCIVSGLFGRALRDALHAHFPGAPRGIVYDAIGAAMSMVEADLLLLEAERNEALRRLAELEARIVRGALAEAGVEA